MKTRPARAGLYLVCLLATTLCPGCGPRNDQKAWMMYADRLSPGVGQAKVDEFVREWGAPRQQIRLSDGYACNWRFSKGTRSAGFAYFISVGQAHEMYDDLTLIFDQDDTLREWKVECIR